MNSKLKKIRIKSINSDILASYSQPQNLDELNMMLKNAVEADKHKIIVLDDDPTGIQTVHDVSVYTDWSKDSITQGFAEKNKLFYVLTNSRAFTQEQTQAVHTEISKTIAEVAKQYNTPYIIVSRSDSTLRGHFPLETQVLNEYIKADGEIICPYFKEGGRFTIGNIHYVKYGNELIPASETEFAKDKTFGYTSSDLTQYIEEKTAGKYLAKNVVTISLDELRQQDIEGICKKLCDVKDFNKVVVNAVDACDLKVFVIAFYRAINKVDKDNTNRKKSFIFRTAAGMVKELGAIDDKPLLAYDDLIVNATNNGGIVVVGSHTKKTTTQLNELKNIDGLEFIEFNSDLVLDEAKFQEEIKSIVERETKVIKSGKTVVVYTKRTLLSLLNDTKEEALLRSVRISDAVQSLVGRLEVTPAFVVAKGGITSSDIGTKALRVKKARVLGQIQPGIPVWQTGTESKFPQIPYIIFPGNVGEVDTLKNVVKTLLEKRFIK